MAELSPRAQEILASVQRDAEARRGSLAAVPDPSANPRLPVVADPSRLLALVEAVTSGAEEVQRRVEALQAALDEIAGRLGLDAPERAAPAGPAPDAPERAAPAVPPPDAPVPALPAALRDAVSAPGPGRLIAPAGGVPARVVEAPALPEDAPAPGGATTSETARLVAVEMAVAGYPRAQVGERLRQQYGVGDPARILDEVFGPGTGADSRVPWT